MRKFSLLILFALCLALPTLAYDFEDNSTGSTIYYSISGSEAIVTYKTYLGRDYSGTIDIPNTVTHDNNTYIVTKIDAYTFYSCSLTSISIGENITSIGAYAFWMCTSLTGSLTLPDGLTTIGEYAFYGCSHLTGSLILPDGLTTIGEHAFCGCSGLTGSLTLPDGLTTIEKVAFSDCTGLTSITVGDNVISIGDYAFDGCSSLTSITIGENVTSIGDYAFMECSSLTSITLGNSVTSIGMCAFEECSNLTSITLGSSVTSIGEGAFMMCSNLTSITSLNTTPPTCDSSVFITVNTSTCVLYVPVGSKDAYSSTSPWSDFDNIEEIELEPTLSVNEAIDVTNNSATLTGSISQGFYDIISQGLEYWVIDSDDVKTIELKGSDISVTITDLEENTEYSYHLYATTNSGTTYSETKTFTTLNATLLGSLVKAINEVQDDLEDAWTTISEEYSDVAENYEEAYNSLSEELEDLLTSTEEKYSAGTLTQETESIVTSALDEILESIASMLMSAKTAENEYLYNIIDEMIKDVESDLATTWKTIETDYSDVADELKEDYEAIKDELDNLHKELEDAYNNVTLTKELADEIKSKLEKISKEIEGLLGKAKQAENDKLHDGLANDIEDALDRLEDVWDEIENDCPDVVDDFKDDYDKLKKELEDLLAELEDAYNNGTLDDEKADEIKDNLDGILDSIDALLKEAEDAQAAGINRIFSELADDVQIYTLSGTRVNTPEKGGIYIFKYAGGTTKKVMIK